jgi:uncharacterized protein (TIGR02246 family)
MKSDTIEIPTTASQDDQEVYSLYRALLKAWNQQNAKNFASLFQPGARSIGFDGSIMTGPAEIESTLAKIFHDHPTAFFIGKVKNLQRIQDIAILMAYVGMVPRGYEDINPNVNAIQTLVAAKSQGSWKIVSFQNTPAAFHGRPEEAEKISAELRESLRHVELRSH